MNVYRVEADRYPPACMQCLVALVCDYFIGHWFCKKCGWCDCLETEKESADPK